MVAAAFFLLAALVQKIVEHVRTWVPIDGLGVFALATTLGFLAALGTDLRLVGDLIPEATVAGWFDVIVSGIALGAGAGFLADISGRSGGE